MNLYQRYTRHDDVAGWTRIELLLALYDKALERLSRAEDALRSGDASVATAEMSRTQIILNELAAGVRIEPNPRVHTNILLLYEYAADQLRRPSLDGIANARNVLTTLREGFEAIRGEANELERSGQIPALNHVQVVHATA